MTTDPTPHPQDPTPSGQQGPSQPEQPGQPTGQQPYPQQPQQPYQQPAQPYQQPAPSAPLSVDDEKTWSILAHVGGIILGFVAPLVIWLIFKDRSGYVDNQAKEALNFQLTLLIAYIAGAILYIIAIGFLIQLAAWVCAVIFGILAAVACSRHEQYRYPFALRLVK